MDKPYCNLEIWGGLESTINRVNDNYFDQLQYAGHYDRVTDIDAIINLGIKKIRFPILWEKHQPSLNRPIDWSRVQIQLEKLRANKIEVIAGLVHHGSGPDFTNLSDPNFPFLLADFAKKVAIQFPWIRYFTPVNEPLTTARFSGLYGLWYPHYKSSQSFVQMLLNELKGTVLAMEEIRKITPEAQLIQTEDLGKTYSTATLAYQARFENERRWLTFDILCGKLNESHKLWNYFKKAGATAKDLDFFKISPCVPDMFGYNHYLTSERFLDERLNLYPCHTHGGNRKHQYADVEAVRVEMQEKSGLKVLLKEAWNRYKKPIAVTEVHLHCHREEQLRWFKEVFTIAEELKAERIDIKAITAWALLGSFGWNKLLTQPKGDYEPGAFDVRSGELRPTALASFIKMASDKKKEIHPLALEPGWWQRNSRILYGPVIKQIRLNKPNPTAPILILGKNGTLGRAFARVCNERYISYKLLGRQDCDIYFKEQIQKAIETYKPWAIVNATGYVKVDDAEHDQNKCFQDNAVGAENLAIFCRQTGVQLISFSTDLVFDGQKNKPYVESDPVHPINTYGKSKAEAEKLILNAHPESLVIRTSAFFGPWDEYNFVHHIRKALLQDERVSVAKDIFISPTYVPDLVHNALDLLIDKVKGIWHLSNQGIISWSDLAYEIAHRFDLDKKLIVALSAAEMNYVAPRPLNSGLSSERGLIMPSLDSALGRYLQEQITEKRKVA
ncbi:MAG: hypothetical protein NVS9B7_28720 [Flavisolibacter sp.]